jgi:hypothetical protein
MINPNFKEDEASHKWEASSSLKFGLIMAHVDARVTSLSWYIRLLVGRDRLTGALLSAAGRSSG